MLSIRHLTNRKPYTINLNNTVHLANLISAARAKKLLVRAWMVYVTMGVTFDIR